MSRGDQLSLMLLKGGILNRFEITTLQTGMHDRSLVERNKMADLIEPHNNLM